MKRVNVKKSLRIIATVAGGLLLVAFLLLGALMLLAVSDREEVPQLVEKVIRENTGGEVTFSHYHFNFLKNFPFLTLTLEDVKIHDPEYAEYRRELLNVESLSVQFRFWKLFRKELEVRSVLLDKGKATLFRNAEGDYFNASFLKGKDKPAAAAEKPRNHPVFSIEGARIRNFSFLLLDSLRSKSYHFDLVDTRVDFNESGAVGLIDVQGDWFFHGLTFKFKNGAYLENQPARVDWRLQWDHEQNRLDIGPATLDAAGETFELSGYLDMDQPTYLKLVIDHPGIMLEKARSIVADNISAGLAKYSIDQPIQAKVVVEGPLIPGKPAPTEIFFSFENAGVAYNDYKGSQTYLQGHFYNCDPEGPVDPHSGCLKIDTISTRLFDVLPIEGNLLIEDLIDSDMQLAATVDMPLPDLNLLLPPGKFEFQRGEMALAFQYQGKIETFAQPWTAATRPQLDGTVRLEDGALRFPSTGLTLNRLQADFRFDEKDLFIRDARATSRASDLRLNGVVQNLLRFIGDPSRQVLANLRVRAGVLDLDQFFPPKPKAAKVRNPSAGKSRGPLAINPITSTIEALLDQFNARLDLEVDKMQIRGFYAREVAMESRLLSYCDQGASASCIFVDTLTAIVYDGIPFGASLKITDLDNPNVEMDMELSTSVDAFREMLPADKILLRDGELVLAFHYEGSLDDYFGLNEVMRDPEVEGSLQLHNLDADYLGGKYRLRDFEADIFFDERDFSLVSGSFYLNDNDITLSGKIYDFTPFMSFEEGELKAMLTIESPVLDFNALPMLKSGSEPAPRKPASEPTAMARKMMAAIDQFEARLRVQTGEVKYHNFRATEVIMVGDYLKGCGEDDSAERCVQIDTFNARIFGNAPLEAAFLVENLADPLITANVQVKTPLTNLNTLFPRDQLRFHGGTIDVAFHYRGQPHDHFDIENDVVKASLSGTTQLAGGAVEYVAKGYRLSDINADLSFNNEDLTIERLALRFNDNPVEINGRFHSLLPYLFVPNRSLNATMEVFSPRFSLDQFSAPAAVEAPKLPSDGTHEPNGLKEIVDSVLNNLRVNFRLNIQEFKARDFEAANLLGDIHLDRHQLNINEASMEMGGGKFHLNGDVWGLADNAPDIEIDAKIEQADMPKVMMNFNNFGLKGISHENIRGILDSEISFRASAGSDYKIDPESMAGQVNLKLVDGELINFPVLRDMNGLLLKSRHFEDVRFATLEKKFRLKDRQILIDDLLVVSSALAFSVDGVYDLNSSGRTDLLFEVPLENLARRGLSETAMKHYKERKHGPSILLEVNRKDGDLRIKPVLSRRKHKEVGRN